MSPFGLACANAWIDDADEAFRYLHKTAATQPLYLGGVASDPSFQILLRDHRWLPFLRSIGQAQEQLAAFEFTVELPR